MADTPKFARATSALTPAALAMAKVTPRASLLSPGVATIRPGAFQTLPGRLPTPTPRPTPARAPADPMPTPRAEPAPELPEAPAEAAWNPVENLPFPAPGDRIKAEHFKALSQTILLIAQAWQMASGLMGRPLPVVRAALAAEGYEVGQVLSVYGRDLGPAGGPGEEARKVLDLRPAALGSARVDLIVSEQAEERLFAPNLIGMTHAQARAALKAALGSRADGPARPAPNLIGRRLADVTP